MFGGLKFNNLKTIKGTVTIKEVESFRHPKIVPESWFKLLESLK